MDGFRGRSQKSQRPERRSDGWNEPCAAAGWGIHAGVILLRAASLTVLVSLAGAALVTEARAEPTHAAAQPKKKARPHDAHHSLGPKPKDARPSAPHVIAPDAPGPLPPVPGAPPTLRATLANGLRVVVAPDPADLAITIALRFDEGAAADPKARGGLAMVSAETLELTSPDTNAAIVARGGEQTLHVNRDSTALVVRVPAAELELGLLSLAERLSPKKTSAAQLDEARERVEQSGGSDLIDERLEALVFQGSAGYAHPLRGTAEERRAISAEDVDGFIRAHFATSNVTLVVSGNVEPKDVTARIERGFGTILRRDAAASEKIGLEEQTNQRSVEIDDTAGSPALVYAWALPQASSPGASVELAAALLTSGPGGRLSRALAEVGGSARATIERRRGPGLFTLRVELPKGVDVTAARRTVETSLAALGKEVVSPTELVLARREAWLSILERMRDPVERAISLADRDLDLEPTRSALERVDATTLRDTDAGLLGPLRRTVVVVRTTDGDPQKSPHVPLAHSTPPTPTASAKSHEAPKPVGHDAVKRPEKKAPDDARHPAKRKGAP